ncbi:homoserine dehydrogenase [Paenibacillus sp. BSR1-1]|uniref:homoserine dehydrogenase n=1 Tax=Paenibacillus sp. BSR1-1 TaxID=3020845 RepID=UPI0025B229A6|nr:homoserine dehydrogenase [Paenibacillus sp. BSR1-1]MDN3017676.1 homoserine dehydrogenase [Paenibacillus sp. BSR1-1]
MTVIKVAILGFGTVGEGVYRTIESHADDLEAVLGKKVEVAAILIKNKQRERNIRKDVLVTTDFEDILNLPKLDIVIEAIVNKEPTFTFLQKAIERGCHIITANKEMFAHHGKHLIALANEKSVSVGFEATVAGGIPVIQTLRQLLKINRVQQIQGILNGTSNFILTEMREKKWSFAEALLQAQKNGYAEADPTNDVEGFDAFYKAMILSRIAFGEEPNWKDVEREGITPITSELIEAAEKLELRFKHIASISKEGTQIQVTVKPALVGKENPFYHVEGVENAVSVHSDIVGRITLQGPGAGMFPTASAVIEDLAYVCQNNNIKRNFNQTVSAELEQKKGKAKEFWLITGLSKNVIKPSITCIDEISNGVFVIRADKKDLDNLGKLDETISYFPILGEFESEVVSFEEKVSAL